MKDAGLFSHFRDIVILPFTVTCVVPFIIYTPDRPFSELTWLLTASGFILSGVGLALFVSCIFLFATVGRGTLAPWSPKKKLVVIGPYRYCRNPMITGVLFILLGEGLLLRSTSILLWALIFFMINTIYFVAVEEPNLEIVFGEEYKTYRKNVHRWIPRLRPYKKS